MSETLRIACAACGYGAELPSNIKELPKALQCPMCGTWIRNFSAEVEAASEPEPAAEVASSTMSACLVEAGSKTLEEQYSLTGAKTVVGRENSDINIEDPTMSIHHFEIELRGGEYFIRDLGSTNHTKVNGSNITATTLQTGDRIQAGLTCLVFLAG